VDGDASSGLTIADLEGVAENVRMAGQIAMVDAACKQGHHQVRTHTLSAWQFRLLF
jgi:hypothetical protein